MIERAFNRHSPDSGSWREEDRPFGRLEQRQIACCVYGRPSKLLFELVLGREDRLALAVEPRALAAADPSNVPLG
jgi:hypothetical protein